MLARTCAARYSPPVLLSDKKAAVSYQPIERQKLYELIADQLLRRISERQLQPGDPLPTERELTQAFRAGRSSVREALRMLESRGVIENRGNGTFVVAGYANPLNSSVQLLLSLDQATMLDVYELRRILECEAAGLAAERHGDAHLALMDAAIDGMAAALASDDDDRGAYYIDADLRFHLAIAEATRNGVILHTMDALRGVIRRALMSIFLVPGSPERSFDQHRAIRDAIAARDADAARAEMRAHLVRVESDVHHALAAVAGGERRQRWLRSATSGSASWAARSFVACSPPTTTSRSGTARLRRRSRCSQPGRAGRRTPREVAEQSEVVFTMVTNTKAVRAVTEGPDGILAGLAPGKVYVDMSTASPANTRDLAARVAEAGAQMLDAPVSGTSITVDQGKASVMVGGDADTFERVKPILDAIGPKVFHLGPSGSAVTIKIGINLSLAVQMLAFSEGVLLAEKSGIPRERAVEVMLASVIASPMVAYRGPLVLGHPDEVWFDCHMMQKDLNLALELGRELEVPLPTTAVTNELLTAANGMGIGERDFAVLFDVLAAMSGVETSVLA